MVWKTYNLITYLIFAFIFKNHLITSQTYGRENSLQNCSWGPRDEEPGPKETQTPGLAHLWPRDRFIVFCFPCVHLSMFPWICEVISLSPKHIISYIHLLFKTKFPFSATVFEGVQFYFLPLRGLALSSCHTQVRPAHRHHMWNHLSWRFLQAPFKEVDIFRV